LPGGGPEYAIEAINGIGGTIGEVGTVASSIALAVEQGAARRSGCSRQFLHAL